MTQDRETFTDNSSHQPVAQPPVDRQIIVDGNARISGGQFGQAEGDLTQIQGDVVNVNIYNARQVAELLDRYHSPASTASPRPTEYRDRQVLLNKIENFWVKDVLERSLHNRALVTLGLEERFEPVQHPVRGMPGFRQDDKQALPAGTELTEVFDEMGEGRTLLLLGEPGSGKTTYLLNLLKVLVKQTKQDTSQPIPVVLNLPSWTSKRKSISAWIVDELYSKYQVSVPLAQSWVTNQNLTLLLDGLDEVDLRYRENCIQAINQFIQKHGRTELVICSRLQDYRNLSVQLKLQGAIYLQPLTSDQIEAYLAQAGEELIGLRTLLKQDTQLQELAKFPLILSVMSLAYQGLPIESLPQTGTLKEKESHLLSAYVNRMLALKSTKNLYPDQQLHKWLSWLSQWMIQTSKTVFLIEEMQPDCLKTRWERQFYDIGIRFLLLAILAIPHLSLLAGHGVNKSTFDIQNVLPAASLALLGCILCSVSIGLSTSWVKGWPARILHGLLFGGIFGPLFEIAYAPGTGMAYFIVYFAVGVFAFDFLSREYIVPIERSRLSLKKTAKHSVFGLIVGVSLYLGSPVSGISCMIFGLAVTLLFGFKKVNNVDDFTIPNQGIWKTATNAVTISLTIGVLVGLAQSFATGPISGLVDGLILGIAAALAGVQGSGIVCLKHFVLRIIMWRGGYTPWNYARFLDYATECFLLQKVGGAYIFMHRSLMEHFSESERIDGGGTPAKPQI